MLTKYYKLKSLLFDLKGVSVLEMVHAFEEASGVKIPVEISRDFCISYYLTVEKQGHTHGCLS